MKWNSIETFFLDMDGTLLDLAFDNFFWHEHLPKIYSESKKFLLMLQNQSLRVCTKRRKILCSGIL